MVVLFILLLIAAWALVHQSLRLQGARYLIGTLVMLYSADGEVAVTQADVRRFGAAELDVNISRDDDGTTRVRLE
jgi:hypothetical protein